MSAGSYRIQVVSPDGGINPNYTLAVNAPGLGPDWAEGGGGNDAQEKASALSVDAFYSGLTVAPTDVDWYSFNTERLPEIEPITIAVYMRYQWRKFGFGRLR